MTIEEGIVTRLLDIAAVTALVSARVHQLKLPQHSALPAIRVQLISPIDQYHLRGGTNLKRARVQVDAFDAETSGTDPYASVVAVAAAIHGDEAGSGLSGWIGSVGGSPDLYISGLFRVDRDPSYEAGDLRLVRMRQDYDVHFRT